MKYLASIFFVFIFAISFAQEKIQYRITDIDSTSRHYLVKVERMDNGELFKGLILSKIRKQKKEFKDKNKIQLYATLSLPIKPYRFFSGSYNSSKNFR